MIRRYPALVAVAGSCLLGIASTSPIVAVQVETDSPNSPSTAKHPSAGGDTVPLPDPPAPIEPSERAAAQTLPPPDAGTPTGGGRRDPFAPSERMQELFDRQRVRETTGPAPRPRVTFPDFRLVGYGDNGVSPRLALLEIDGDVMIVRENDLLPLQPEMQIHVVQIGPMGVLLQADPFGEFVVR